jgi:hypothetical protein
VSQHAAAVDSGARPRLHGNPLRLAVSRGLWAGVGYLLGYQVVGWALFAIAVTVSATAVMLSVTLAGLPLLIAAAGTLRGCANFERWRLRMVFPGPVRGGYRRVTRPGIMAQVGTRWKDPATWRDIAYLIGLFVPLVVIGFAVLLVWLLLLAGITVPAWYWAPVQSYPGGGTHHGLPLGYFPNGPSQPGTVGIFVDTLPKALLAALACLVLLLLFNYVLMAVTRMHAAVARALLRRPADPLAPAREMLARPGPLPPLVTASEDGLPAPPRGDP